MRCFVSGKKPSIPFFLASILLVALFLRIGMLFYWERRVEPPFFFGDSETYWDLGRQIAQGKPYAYGASGEFRIFRMPGYPCLLAPLFLFGGDNPPVLFGRLLSVAFGVSTVWAAWLLASRLFSGDSTLSRQARDILPLLAASYVAVDPLQVVSSVLILSEAPFGFFMLMQIYCWSRMFQASRSAVPTVRNVSFLLAAMLGLSSAACVYLRPAWFYFPPFVIVLQCLGYIVPNPVAFFVRPLVDLSGRFVSGGRVPESSASGRGIRFQHTGRLCRISNQTDAQHARGDMMALYLTRYLIAVSVFSICLFPWCLRNHRVSGHVVATTLQTGASLYDGLNPEADGSSDMRFVARFRDSEPLDSPTYEYDVDTKMKRAALAWAAENPGAVLRLALHKFHRLWNCRPNEPAFSSPAVQAGVFLSYVPVLLFGLLGSVMIFRRGMEWGMEYRLLLAPAIYITMLHVVFVASIRYRTPAMLLLAIPAAYAFLRLVDFCIKKTT